MNRNTVKPARIDHSQERPLLAQFENTFLYSWYFDLSWKTTFFIRPLLASWMGGLDDRFYWIILSNSSPAPHIPNAQWHWTKYLLLHFLFVIKNIYILYIPFFYRQYIQVVSSIMKEFVAYKVGQKCMNIIVGKYPKALCRPVLEDTCYNVILSITWAVIVTMSYCIKWEVIIKI